MNFTMVESSFFCWKSDSFSLNLLQIYIQQFDHMKEPQNPSPLVHNIFSLSNYEKEKRRQLQLDDTVDDPFDQLHINDPQYPLTLEQLNIVTLQDCKIINQHLEKYGRVEQVKRCLSQFHTNNPTLLNGTNNRSHDKIKIGQVRVYVKEGMHENQKEINKQINDKERVAAATENNNIQRVLQRGFLGSDRFTFSQIPF